MSEKKIELKGQNNGIQVTWKITGEDMEIPVHIIKVADGKNMIIFPAGDKNILISLPGLLALNEAINIFLGQYYPNVEVERIKNEY